MRTLRLITFCLLVIVAFAPHALSDVSAEERKQAFVWFDTLGYPDVTKLTLVHVYDHRGGGFAEDLLASMRCDYGFLTESDAKKFSVFRLTLGTSNFTVRLRTKDGIGTDFEKLDLRTYVERLMKWQTEDTQAAMREHRGSIEMFLLARVCESQGLSAQAAQLCNMVAHGLSQNAREGRPFGSFRAQIEDLLGDDAVGSLMAEFGDLTVTRANLLARFDLCFQQFPIVTRRSDIVDTVNELRRMVVEDQEHAARPATQARSVSQQMLIEDLIYALRDQNGWQMRNPGGIDVFLDSRNEKSPAAQLRKIGLPAVPALIEALTDTRLTRSVSTFSSFGRSAGPPLLIGDAARQILEEIVSQRFDRKGDITGAGSWNDRAVAVQKEARLWWAEIEAKGETQVLIEGVRRGDDNAIKQAYRLSVLDPNLAVPAMTEAINHISDGSVREILVGIVGDLHRSSDLPLLKQQLHQGKEMGTRLEAAKALHQRGDPEAVPRMIEEWRRRPERDVKDDVFAQIDVSSLINFLAQCGSPYAMKALETGLQDRSIDTRFEVADALYSPGCGFVVRPLKPVGSATESSKTQQACAAVAQSLLVGMLQDKENRRGAISMTYDRNEPRLCDFANAVLAKLWPHTYRYHEGGSLFERDKGCIETANRWRSMHGLKPLPFPKRPSIRPTSASLIDRNSGLFRKRGNRCEHSG